MMRHPVPSHVVNLFAEDRRRARIAALARCALGTAAIAAGLAWLVLGGA